MEIEKKHLTKAKVMTINKVSPKEFYENQLKIISTNDDSELSKKMKVEIRKKLADIDNNSSAKVDTQSAAESFENDSNDLTNNQIVPNSDDTICEKTTFMKVFNEDGTTIKEFKTKKTKKSITSFATDICEEVHTLSDQHLLPKIKKEIISQLPASILTNNVPIMINNNTLINSNTDNILRTGKTPRINIEIFKNLILQSIDLINIDNLRVYNNEQGYYQLLSEEDLLIELNGCIPLDKRLYTEPSDCTKVYKALKLDPRIKLNRESLSDNNKLINCRNGVLNLSDISLNKKPFMLDHNKQYYFLNCVQAKYNPNYDIRGSNFQNFIMSITNHNYELITLIQEVLGYVLSNFNNAKKSFFLYGESNSGKSVLLKLIANICGEENVSNINLQDLSKETQVSELHGKLINISSELPDKGIEDTGSFKSLVSETDKVPARHLYGRPFSFYNKCKLIFATNNLPEIKTAIYKDNEAFFNRLVIIPFRNSISENSQDKDLVNKLMLERDLIFSWAVDGIVRYIENGFKFSECYESTLALSSYSQNSNSVLLFLSAMCTLDKNSYVHMDKLYDAYIRFCKDSCLETPNSKDKKILKNTLTEKYKLKYRKLNRSDGNKYGFEGLELLNNELL